MSNYEITKNRVQKEFVKYDQKKMVEKFHLEHDEEYIYVKFVQRKYRIHRSEGRVTWVELPEERIADVQGLSEEKLPDIARDLSNCGKMNLEEDIWRNEREANFNEVLTIFDVLCDSKDGCAASGEFANMQSLSSIKGSTGNVGGSLFKAQGKFFDGHVEEMERACIRLGGVKRGKGDVSYEIPMFEFLSFMIQFWESDDEFDASLEIFVDKNTLQFMRYETMWYAVSHLLERIREEMMLGGNDFVRK